jgi:twitching motility protein PilT
VNSRRAANIITIEDPVEFQIQPRQSAISQRELGIDVPSYHEAMRFVVRQDPDIIFIGELRDHETVLAAIQAAETGHLVFGSLHTADVAQCFSRMVEFFPQNEHAFIRSSLAGTIRAVCAQRLVPANKDVTGTVSVPACEVLLANPSVRDAIRESKDADLPAIIAAHKQDGMCSFTESLADLVEKDMISVANAMDAAPNRDLLSARLKGVQVRAATMTGARR